MSSVVFNSETLMWSGTDRDKLPYEVDIKNVDLNGLMKQSTFTTSVGKVDDDGNQLYLLTLEPKTVVEEVEEIIETTEVTDFPIIMKKVVSEPVLDAKGQQVIHQMEKKVRTTNVTGEPVMVTQVVDGVEKSVHEVDENGKKLYWEVIPIGEPQKAFVSKEVEVHKTDSNDAPLYHKTIIHEIHKTVPVTEEITSSDPRYKRNLPVVVEERDYTETIFFNKNPEMFNYDEVLAHKEKSITKGTFYQKGRCFEKMQGVFSGGVFHEGFDFITIPSGLEATTVALELPYPAELVMIKVESNIKPQISFTSEDSDKFTKINILDEADFGANKVSKIKLRFTNTSDNPIVINGFSILV